MRDKRAEVAELERQMDEMASFSGTRIQRLFRAVSSILDRSEGRHCAPGPDARRRGITEGFFEPSPWSCYLLSTRDPHAGAFETPAT